MTTTNPQSPNHPVQNVAKRTAISNPHAQSATATASPPNPIPNLENATNRGTMRPLKSIQRHALNLIILGHSDAEVASELGVARSTVLRWRTKHPAFISAIETAHQNVISDCERRLASLTSRAIDILEDALECEDNPKYALSAAVHILRIVGLYSTKSSIHQFAPPYTPEALTNSSEDDEETIEPFTLVLSSPRDHLPYLDDQTEDQTPEPETVSHNPYQEYSDNPEPAYPSEPEPEAVPTMPPQNATGEQKHHHNTPSKKKKNKKSKRARTHSRLSRRKSQKAKQIAQTKAEIERLTQLLKSRTLPPPQRRDVFDRIVRLTGQEVRIMMTPKHIEDLAPTFGGKIPNIPPEYIYHLENSD